jgi:hypothetical protein
MLTPLWFQIFQVMSVLLAVSKKPIGFVELPGVPVGLLSELNGAQLVPGVVVTVGVPELGV